MPTIIPIPAFDDNYIWLLHNQHDAIVIDPGDAAPVVKALNKYALDLRAILITHHHNDHIGGVKALQQTYNAEVYAPSYGHYSFEHIAVSEGDEIDFPSLGLKFETQWLPGHTLDHIAYLSKHLLFCGDVMFGAGCGRLFEGTPQQMLHSLNRLKMLNPDTQIFCAHEYTAKNIEFALTIEPNNQHLIERRDAVAHLRAQKQPSVPSTIGLERLTNPYLRGQLYIDNVATLANFKTELAIFTELRMRRNHF
jgi:hydroxyacylglutathione hydrolase